MSNDVEIIEGFYLCDGTPLPDKSAFNTTDLWVYANKSWQSTGFSVSKGQKFRIYEFAHGYRPLFPDSPYELWDARWSSHPAAFGPTLSLGAKAYPAPNGYVVPGAPESSLCYRIGSGPAKSPSHEETAYADGTVSFMINDDAGGNFGAGLGDNRGRVHMYLEYL